MTNKRQTKLIINNVSGIVQIAIVASVMAFSFTARASYTIDFYNNGVNLVAAGFGTIDLTDLSDGGTIGFTAGDFSPASGHINFVVSPHIWFSGVSGAYGWTSISSNLTSTPTGSSIGVDAGSDHWILVPSGYVSGTYTSGQATYANESLLSLGLTNNSSFTYTWGSGAHADSLTVNMGVEPVPEPSTYALFGLGALALIVAYRRKAA